MDEIGADHIDTLILSLPDKIFTYGDLPKELILPMWSTIQQNLKDKYILTAGLSDFNAKYLDELINALEETNVCYYLFFKWFINRIVWNFCLWFFQQIPSLNQVNLTSCCKIPEDLVQLAKLNHIQLTTHIDPKGNFAITLTQRLRIFFL